jgi:selenocysteine-specific elongation factor
MHVIGTAGHVDHGKSTLVERLTGIDPDRFEEEKRRGLTIDLGFAWMTLPSGEEVGIIDVPGHERFIKNMLAGAGGINVCLFVVAANEGWKPQSSEHLAIVDVLGVSHGVIALTKTDLVDGEMVQLAAAEIEERIASSSLAGAPIVPCSSVTGEGIDDLIAALDRVVNAAPPPPDMARPRLWVDRVFTIAGAGTVVTGTLAGGTFSVGDEVEVLPERRRARVRTLQSHKKQVETIGPGNRVAMNLVGLERQGARRGDAVVGPKRWRATNRVDARLAVLPEEIAGASHELTEKGAHLMYAGSAETPVRVKLIGTRKLAVGEAGFAQLSLRDPLPLARGDKFVLRDVGRVLTFGGGEVLDPLPEPVGRHDGDRAARLGTLAAGDDGQAAQVLLDESGIINEDELLLRAGAPAPRSRRAGHWAISERRFEELRDETLSILREYHAAHPLEAGMPREALRAKLDLATDVFDALLGQFEDVTEVETLVRVATHSVQMSHEDAAEHDRIVAQIEASGFAPPLARDLEGDENVVRSMVQGGDLVRIGDFYLTRAQAQTARESVRRHIDENGPVTVAQIRDLLGTSRKYAVPLCEWLDSTGATRRHGDLRALGPRA